MQLIEIARQAVAKVPEVLPYLRNSTRFKLLQPEAYKSYEYFLTNAERLVRSLYAGIIGGEFLDTFANLISGQIRDAFEKAWADSGYDGGLPPYLEEAYQEFVSNQYSFLDQFFRDIIDARIDGTSLDALMIRAKMWAARWNEAYQEALRLITMTDGGNLVWIMGETEHCSTCQALSDIVASAREWTDSGFHPQGSMLECGGYNCQCELLPTSRRRSKNAFERIMAAG